MSTREWKPGDVAKVDGSGTRRPITFYEDEETGELMFTNGHGFQHPASRLAGDARPLVVIDPEDREQVTALSEAVMAQPQSDIRPLVDTLRDALRSFIEPPKPEEPQGLGAVVEDADGQLWVRHEQTALAYMHWHRVGGNSSAKWQGVRAVKVLSEGVS